MPNTPPAQGKPSKKNLAKKLHQASNKLAEASVDLPETVDKTIGTVEQKLDSFTKKSENVLDTLSNLFKKF